MFTLGTFVQTWFNTGAFGYDILYGKIVKCGKLTFTVQWESGSCNRFRHNDHPIKIANDQVHAEKAFMTFKG